MLRQFVPDLFVKSIFDIDLQALQARGIKGIVTDLDNTLVEWNAPDATPKLVQWLDRVREHGFQVCIVSNNDATRVESFAKPLGLPCIADAKKPRRGAFEQALAMIGANQHDTVMIGDQIFTDIAGGNRMGMFTILVAPISQEEWIGTRFTRKVEHVVLNLLRKKGLITWQR
ncbi:YqeG family HAD IIIA-type phosphatase [Fodinisporobacter ferrooxydans]|uniref:YqeG family HAD IIIA-type phosphatase n=1 Tax=Fodinisporobacter ferrooxydans TaxID=2901836 RepID=A0ABY4CFV2_9BACL|nr:YqeG family HAD IIIA-type phosphatase [Alicyclobacillaceae bacterium MYW30-H2]